MSGSFKRTPGFFTGVIQRSDREKRASKESAFEKEK